jgi:hypothetical protein
MSTDPAEAVAPFRYRVIAEAANARLTPSERGRLVRELALHAHEYPDGSQRQFARGTLDRWVRAYREQGLDGLKPQPRADLGLVRRHPALLEEACQLRAELPARSAVQIGEILFARHGIHVAQRTISQHLRQRGLHRAALAGQPRAYGRFEAARPNEVWIGDVLVGPFVPHPRVQGSRRAYLFVLVDDYSRLLLHGRWVPDQNTRAGQEVLRAAIQRRGVPERLYVDNGAPYAKGTHADPEVGAGTRQRGARAELRRARHSADPQPPLSARRPWQAGAAEPLHSRALPDRGRSSGHPELHAAE